MTSKEKAIEALNKFYSDWLEDCFEADWFFRTDGLYSNIIDELSKPTLDDAIKVVEDMIENNEIKLSEHAGGVSRMLDLKYANANYRDVITALKGLKGE